MPIFAFVVRHRSEPFAYIPPAMGVQLGVYKEPEGNTAKDTPNGIDRYPSS
jgi:hypothetical protein